MQFHTAPSVKKNETFYICYGSLTISHEKITHTNTIQTSFAQNSIPHTKKKYIKSHRQSPFVFYTWWVLSKLRVTYINILIMPNIRKLCKYNYILSIY